MLANAVTVSRMLLSLLLLFLPRSPLFALLYLLCGVSDALDGFLARRLHTESETGAALDSAADLLFAVVYIVRILPLLSIPLWICIWAAVIGAVKLAIILQNSRRAHRLSVAHSPANRLTGLLLFLLPLTVRVIDAAYGAGLVCAAATFAAVEDICAETATE